MNTEKTIPVTAIVLGASGRGKLYGDYSLEHPEDLQITGIAELVELRRTYMVTNTMYPGKTVSPPGKKCSAVPSLPMPSLSLPPTICIMPPV